MKNISTLKDYVETKNMWNRIFKKKLLDLSNAEDRRIIADSIDSELSPENLSCDGELSRSKVQARYRKLTKVLKELQSL